MIDRFTMTQYYNQYIEARTKLDRMKRKIKDLRAALIYSEDLEAALEELQAAEAASQAQESQVDDLWCLYQSGQHRKDQAPGIQWQKSKYGPFNKGHGS